MFSGAEAAPLSAVFVTASEASLSRPHDLTLSPDGHYLYVADVGNDAVTVLDPETLRILGAFGTDQLSAPHDVAFMADGRLLVADTGNNRIAIFEVDGTTGRYVGEWRDGMDRPEGVDPGADGRVYATNVGHSNVVMLRDGRIVKQVGSYGDGPNEYVRPHDIEVGPDGGVYVSDPGNNRIQILSPNLDFLEALETPPFRFNEPKYFALDPEGWLYIADEFNNQIKILGPDHGLRLTIGSGERGRGPNLFSWPEGAEVMGDRLWISDTRNNRIVLYRLEGSRELQ